jgi:hypothetical protein
VHSQEVEEKPKEELRKAGALEGTGGRRRVSKGRGGDKCLIHRRGISLF